MNLLILMVNVGHMNHTGILWEMEFGKHVSSNIHFYHSILCTETVVDVRGVGFLFFSCQFMCVSRSKIGWFRPGIYRWWCTMFSWRSQSWNHQKITTIIESLHDYPSAKWNGTVSSGLRSSYKTRWWVQTFFYFHPLFGKISNLTNIFSNGLKPPTRRHLYVWLLGLVRGLPGLPLRHGSSCHVKECTSRSLAGEYEAWQPTKGDGREWDKITTCLLWRFFIHFLLFKTCACHCP